MAVIKASHAPTSGHTYYSDVPGHTPGDGIFARYILRPAVRPLARAIAPALAPWAASGASLAAAAGAGALLAANWNIAAAFAVLVAAVAAILASELRAAGTGRSQLALISDAAAACYADALLLGGLTAAAIRFEHYAHAEFVGALALGASLTLSYSRVRLAASMPGRDTFDPATRDTVFTIAGVGAAAEQTYWALAIIGALCAATVVWRLVVLRVVPTPAS